MWVVSKSLDCFYVVWIQTNGQAKHEYRLKVICSLFRARDGKSYVTKLFDLEPVMIGAEGTVPKYSYKHADLRPWDPRNDLLQYEKDYEVCTKTRHKTPMIRTQSIVSVLDAGKVNHAENWPLLNWGGKSNGTLAREALYGDFLILLKII